MLSEKTDGPDPDGQDASRQKKQISWSNEQKWNSTDRSGLRPLRRPCREPFVTQVRRRRFQVVLRSSRSSELNVLRVRTVLGVVHHAYSTPGAFIAQIAAINRAFARGRTVKLSANAVSGQTDMPTHSGELKFVSANRAIGTTM